MRIIMFMVLLLESISAQKDSLLQYCLEKSASNVKNKSENTLSFFSTFFNDSLSAEAAALILDTNKVYFFDVEFNAPPEYILSAGMISLSFNYVVHDKKCNCNRNGILLYEKNERTEATKKNPEKLSRELYILIPDKCSSTRFYNAKGEMLTDNKKQFIMNYEEGKKTAEQLKVKVGMRLLSTSRGEYYEEKIPATVEITEKGYVLRCCIGAIVFLKGDEILDNFVSLK